MFLKKAIFCLAVLPIATVAGRAEDLPVLPAGSEPLCFAVLGDTHYIPPDYKVAPHIHAIAEEIRAQHPAVRFVCHTGDVVEGGTYKTEDGKRRFVRSGYESMKAQFSFAIRDLTESLGRPLFIAVGNHDKHDPGHKAYNETVLPLVARQLQRPITQTSYAFRCGGACFVFLDYAPDDYQQQAKYLEGIQADARRATPAEHVFVFAHFPLWPVVRAGFSSSKLSASLLPPLLAGPLDAYFCGHTHDATVCVRQFPTGRITQIQGVTTSSSNALIPLEQRRALLFPAAEAPFCWGYLEGSQTGYHIVRVEGGKVHVQWRLPGRGALYEFAWEKPGQLIDIRRPQAAAPPITVAAVREAREAAIAFCPWTEQPTDIALRLNGQSIATTRLEPTYSPFWEDRRISLPHDKLPLLQLVNRLEVENPGRAVFGFAHARLEVVLADGSRVNTAVCSDFCLSARQADASSDALRKGWRAAPPAMLKEVALGQPLGPVKLAFPGPVAATVPQATVVAAVSTAAGAPPADIPREADVMTALVREFSHREIADGDGEP